MPDARNIIHLVPRNLKKKLRNIFLIRKSKEERVGKLDHSYHYQVSLQKGCEKTFDAHYRSSIR